MNTTNDKLALLLTASILAVLSFVFPAFASWVWSTACAIAAIVALWQLVFPGENRHSIETECGQCAATGIYVGSSEPKDAGVWCHNCKGTGKLILNYTLFTKRWKRTDIKKVYATGFYSPDGQTPITYQEFLDGKLPG